jgi:hypothetical protein
MLIRKLIAEHAHRLVFACSPDAFVEEVRPRLVDAQRCKQEADEWRNWHAKQARAERDLMGWNGGSAAAAT